MSKIFDSDDVAHVVVSCENRNTVEISAPVKLSKELLEESIRISQKSLAEVLSLNVVRNEDSTNEYIHTLVFVSYSHELCNKLKEYGATKAVFYVGHSWDPKKVQVLNETPEFKMVKNIDENGNPIEFMSDVVSL